MILGDHKPNRVIQSHSITMDKELMQEDQKYLPSHLLDDDDVPTATSLKNTHQNNKEMAFSAPPIFFNLGYRLEEDFFDQTEKTWAVSAFNTPQKNSMKQKQRQTSEFELQLNNTRKLSLQNDMEYHNYQSYQNIGIPEIHYYSSLSPEQQILNNLEYVSEWCKDQYGSRNLQTTLQTANQFVLGKIFQAIQNRMGQLIYDKFGNYVIQKFVQVGAEKHKQAIYEFVKKDMLFISLHSFGCRVVQKIVEYATRDPQMQAQIMKQLQPHLLQILMNQNGNHIIQRILELFSEVSVQSIAKIITDNIQKLSFHAYGCRVIQKYLQNAQNAESREFIMEKLIAMSIPLSKCQYGNYIMQYIVSRAKQHHKQVLEWITQHFVELSCNKFASNVIEKAIKSAGSGFIDMIIVKLVDNHEFVTLAKNQFGNYVIQSLLERCQKDKKQLLKNELKQNCQEISKSQYGRHVLMQMEKHK